MSKLALIGYVKNTNFGPYWLPLRFQNQLLKIYCESKKKIFHLSQAEPYFLKNNIQLNSLKKIISKNLGIVTLSLFMMPNNKNERHKFFQSVLKKKSQIHFVFENIVLKDEKTLKDIEKYIKIRNFFNMSQKIFLKNKNLKQ